MVLRAGEFVLNPTAHPDNKRETKRETNAAKQTNANKKEFVKMANASTPTTDTTAFVTKDSFPVRRANSRILPPDRKRPSARLQLRRLVAAFGPLAPRK